MARENVQDRIDLEDFEDCAYPHFTQDTRAWLRQNRALVRAFLESDLGRCEEAGQARERSRSRKRAVRRSPLSPDQYPRKDG